MPAASTRVAGQGDLITSDAPPAFAISNRDWIAEDENLRLIS
jgi:hypothetical protein